ncbi:MAG TPA: adenosylmethionine--8-amino-7-oxononanoate transaminase [Puia sp.]|nr:adenosylmethionine--8-amino-7-oxononanoate transaminase [Puia sp.]
MINSLGIRDAEVIWHPYTQHKNLDLPIPILKGNGSLLFDDAGNSYIDAISSWWVNIHGHSNPYIAEKIYRQAQDLEQVIFTNFTHEPAVRLAERLISILPGNQSKIFYSDNGSTAVEVALKMAIQYWINKGITGRNTILAFENAYHGDTFGAMSVSGRGIFTNAFKDFLFDVVFIETPNADNLEEIKSIIKSKKEKIAAFIYEPLLQAAGGMNMYDAENMDQLLSFVRSEQIICIADEVLTGFGRTGSLFASESLSNYPDIICLSKGLTGGFLALGATACRQFIFDAFLSDDRSKTFFHGHSYTANPLACAAGLASLDLLQEKTCLDKIREIQFSHEQFVSASLSKSHGNFFLNPRFMGTILAFELNDGKNNYTNNIGREIMKQALGKGIYLRPLGNTVYLMPPYCITDEELNKIYRFILSIPDVLKV